ncbi:acetylglutamate kinase [Paenibacillus spiritus]|uniref:Acetylglutamate kinase n=1 Tax=Paenibacillus spiritus TaxID=2496557 RepID=A0A5J5FVX7_9BACL|nr:acetylglutamate kinase [Paenibacillus spiritus]KAA8997958.1 acetylglutamate kinase [Paenibacillus spiritus]
MPQQTEGFGAARGTAPGRFIMKCGGSTLAALPDSFFADLKSLLEQGIQPVIVHGGGPAISENLGKLGIESAFVNGLRVTTEEVLDVVEMTLAGSINKAVVRRIQRAGGRALGLSGEDGGLLEAAPVENSAEVGLVGHVVKVKTDILEGILKMGYIPVVAPIGIDGSGQRYNVNADTAAGAVASHMEAPTLIVVTDVPGIMAADPKGKKAVLPSVTTGQIEALIGSGEIYGGMIPKVRAAIDCIQGSVSEVIIVDGKEPQILSRVLSGEAVGTRIAKE